MLFLVRFHISMYIQTLNKIAIVIMKMNVEENKSLNEQAADLLCVSCKRFYGSEQFSKMCSQCFKKNQSLITPKKQQKEQLEPEVVMEVKEQPKPVEEKKQVNKDKCSTCNRKLKLLGIQCKCGLFFCNHHRLPEDHTCTFNHKSAAKQKLSKQIFKVEKGKIESI